MIRPQGRNRHAPRGSKDACAQGKKETLQSQWQWRASYARAAEWIQALAARAQTQVSMITLPICRH